MSKQNCTPEHLLKRLALLGRCARRARNRGHTHLVLPLTARPSDPSAVRVSVKALLAGDTRALKAALAERGM